MIKKFERESITPIKHWENDMEKEEHELPLGGVGIFFLQSYSIGECQRKRSDDESHV